VYFYQSIPKSIENFINSGLINVNDIKQLWETQDKKIVTAMGINAYPDGGVMV
jgi:hypothetical protein